MHLIALAYFLLSMYFRNSYAENSIKLPVVDISPWLDGSYSPTSKYSFEQIEKLKQAAATFGTAYISTGNKRLHYLHEYVLDESSKRVFDLPVNVKENYQIQSKGFTRGFVLLGGESGSRNLREIKEGFSYGKEWDPDKGANFDNDLQGFNVWPNSDEGMPDEDKKTLIDLYEELCLVSKSLVRVIALALGLENQYALDESITESDTISIVRLFHYFGTESNPELFSNCGLVKNGLYEHCTGSSPHTDWGMLTLVGTAHGDSGLEFFLNNSWKKVVPETDNGTPMLVVNFGDYLSLATGSLFKSPLHRVITGTVERHSFVYFFYPNFHSKLQLESSKERGNTLSLLEQQGQNKNSQYDGNDSRVIESFGRYILNKWSQVFRSKDTTEKDEL